MTDAARMQITIRLRLRSKHAASLNRQARAVNLVWNYCNEAQRHVLRWDRWLSTYELHRLTAGTSKELGLHAHTIQRVCRDYVDARRCRRTPWLRWRGEKSLGWVPFNTGHVSFDGAGFVFNRVRYETTHLRDLLKPGVKIGAGSFNRDARGRWYINCPVEVPCAEQRGVTSVGVDLGLKTLAVLSTGAKIEMPSFYRKSERQLATAQRSRKTRRARAIHAKTANRRKDYLHKASTDLAKGYGLIVIGGISPSKLVKTSMAKSVGDAGWSDFKRMLSYKAMMHGGTMLEVSEAYTSQTCSSCGSLPPERPRGIAGLGIREWDCSACGVRHDRDVNAARNILALGRSAAPRADGSRSSPANGTTAG